MSDWSEWTFLFLSTLNWLGLICFFVGLLLFIAFLVLLLKSDCDLSLKFYEKVGANPSQALRGKVVWITGASSGIGEDLCYTLASCGVKLILSARREKKLRTVLEKCKGKILLHLIKYYIFCKHNNCILLKTGQ